MTSWSVNPRELVRVRVNPTKETLVAVQVCLYVPKLRINLSNGYFVLNGA